MDRGLSLRFVLDREKIFLSGAFFLETKKLCKPGNPTTENKATEIKESERGGTA